MTLRFYAAGKVTPWYWAIMGAWVERSLIRSSAVDVGSFMEPNILEEGRAAPGGQNRH